MSKLPIIILVGATASGKSALSLPLAESLNAEIVCMDSMQVYLGMDIGTAKPTLEEQARVPHHLLDLIAPTENFSTAAWLSQAEKVIDEISARGKRILFCGGTGLYMKAFLDGLFQVPPVDPELRESLRKQGLEEGSIALHRRLESIDPTAAATIHPNDLRRISRALEVCYQTGVPISDLRRDQAASPWRSRSIAFGIQRGMDDLERRINERTRWMFENGIVEETRKLLESGCVDGNTSMQGLGYRECVRHLRGELSLDETVALVVHNTRKYAKRQGTWFRKDKSIHWLVWPEGQDQQSLLEATVAQLATN